MATGTPSSIILRDSKADGPKLDPFALERYSIDGLGGVPSVTQILRAARICPDYSAVDPEALANAASRGTEIHEQVEAWITSGKTPRHPRALSVTEAMGRELLDSGFFPLGCEMAMTTRTPLPFGGTLDSLWGRDDAVHSEQEVVVVDVKNTAAFGDYYFVQCSGYKLLAALGQGSLWFPKGSVTFAKPMVLWSRPDGRPAKVKRPVDKQADMRFDKAFTGALKLWYDKAAAGLPQ